MTEQSKIPVPPKGKGENGDSLFERATGAFGLGEAGDAIRAAPVPRDLANIPSRLVRKQDRPEPTPEARVAADESPATSLAAPSPAIATQPATPAVQTAPVPSVASEPLKFSGPQHTVDRDGLREQGMIDPEGAVSQLLEEFRIVKRQILVATRDAQRNGPMGKAQRVLICSPLPGEGKTFCATNLALAIAAEKDSEVLLVDADFAKPSVLSTLGLPGGPGFMDALADPALKVEDCVIGTDVPGLWVLPAGNQTSSDSEYLASSRTEQVLDRLTQGAPNRMVIFDSPPALAASPAAELAKYVGQAVLVARADSTGQTAIEDALSLLSACPDIKLLLNDARFSPSGRRFGAYYGYGG